MCMYPYYSSDRILKYLMMMVGVANGNPVQFLAWRIPQTEDPGRLLLGRRVGHN